MSDAPDELESAMILGDPAESISLDTIKAMARAVRDAGWVKREDERECDHNFTFTETTDSGTRVWCATCHSAIRGEA